MRALGYIGASVLVVLWVLGACSATGSAPRRDAGSGASSEGGGGAGGEDMSVAGAGPMGGSGGGNAEDECAAADAENASFGCEFWAVKPDIGWAPSGWCFAAAIVNSSKEATHITVSRDGVTFDDPAFIGVVAGQGENLTFDTYDPVLGLPPGEVAVAVLSRWGLPPHGPPCSLPGGYSGEGAIDGTGIGSAFLIKTDRPVVVYSIWPFATAGIMASASASLLLPASSWGTNYIAVNPYEKAIISGVGAAPSLSILARENETEVTILPRVDLLGGTPIPPTPANTPVAVMLHAGQYLQINQPAELTGSVIAANKPIGLWGTTSSYEIPASGEGSAVENAHQQIPPIQTLGHRYAGVRHKNRAAAVVEEAPPWRIVGAVDGTELSWTPALPPGAPTTLSTGEMVEFRATGPFIVESQDAQHPFYVAQYMTGIGEVCPDLDVGEGDPEFVNVVPLAQQRDHYVFFTDPTYPETSLVVVRQRSPQTNAFEDVTLDCAGVLGGWQAVGDVEYTYVQLVTGNFEPVAGCENGRHEMSSAAPFGVTVWGWGGYSELDTRFVSYAYPVGASVGTINDVEVPAIPR